MSTIKIPAPPLRVVVVVASTRPRRLGPAVARWFVEATSDQAERQEVEVDVVDLAEVGLPFLDEPEEPSTGRYLHQHTLVWSSLVAAADAFVLVTPNTTTACQRS